MPAGINWIVPVNCTPGSTGAWTDVDLDTYIGGLPASCSGVILHIVNAGVGADRAIGLRKNGSTDNRTTVMYSASHFWAAVGVDSNHIFEAYIGHLTEQDIYIVGWTDSGITFLDNAVEKSPLADDTWRDMDCSVEAPNAVGLFFETDDTSIGTIYYGLRKNGSTDDRWTDTLWHGWAVIGCDASQIAEARLESADVDIWLTGYITANATFNTNAIDRSLGGAGAWTDIVCTAGATGVFIEVTDSSNFVYGLRKDGSAENIYQPNAYHHWGMVEALANTIEGKVSSTALDFFEVGYSTAAAPAPSNPQGGSQAEKLLMAKAI
jgi:hypothetical protein